MLHVRAAIPARDDHQKTTKLPVAVSAFAHHIEQSVSKHSLQCQKFETDSSPGEGHLCMLAKAVDVILVSAKS